MIICEKKHKEDIKIKLEKVISELVKDHVNKKTRYFNCVKPQESPAYAISQHWTDI